MKRMALSMLLVLCMFALVSCGQSGESPETAEESGSGAEDGEIAQETEWTAREIEALFCQKNANADWSVVDCVAAADFAFERVGVVLFTDVKEQTSNLAFMDQDGNCQRCGIHAKTHMESELTYLGNGVVTVQLETQDGAAYTCKITFSAEDGNVHFVVEDDL
ncbi:hypothetical protein [Oscillibacter sp.]|uniref:LptM family lipoprotein n=1 Tax=Oscillibacter sp. TaxID=1945593 RepID=UPI002616A5C5|nr:hypothetical protein [Oscillibacter sp.]MDD3347544.1 hypothetical protein [Oscillibacter sp.]